MKRFAWVWGITALCACIAIAAMSVMTRHVLRLEEVSQKAMQEKDHAEKIRRALWRMESEANAILLLENTRSVEKFLEATSDTLPSYVRTYFQFNASGGYACMPAAARVEKKNIGTILNATCATPSGVVSNASFANSMANRWSDNTIKEELTSPEWGGNYNSQTDQVQERAMRGELVKRNIAKIYGQNTQIVQQPAIQQTLIAGDFRPIWMDGELFLVRKLIGNDGNTAQGVWLHQADLKMKLLALTKDLFPGADLVPATENIEDDALALVSIPWRLAVAETYQNFVPSTSAAMTAMRFAWVGIGIAFAAGTALVFGLVRLSERRGTFVSSVTHELRTPLTTFQLYSDLLASGMVKEEEKKQQYYETLRREADRLGHLVENVLAFAQVERGSARGGMRSCSWGDFFPAIIERMEQRLSQSNLELAVQFDDEFMAKQIITDPAAIEHILFNLADNAAKYAHPHTSPKVILEMSQNDQQWSITVRDFGPGIEKSEWQHIFKAFQKSKKANDGCKSGVGLGLSLSRRLARSINASLTYMPAKGEGASFTLRSPI